MFTKPQMRRHGGANSPYAKLTREQVYAIRFGGEVGRDVAKRFGISEQNVSKIRHGRSWRMVTGEG